MHDLSLCRQEEKRDSELIQQSFSCMLPAVPGSRASISSWLPSESERAFGGEPLESSHDASCTDALSSNSVHVPLWLACWAVVPSEQAGAWRVLSVCHQG